MRSVGIIFKRRHPEAQRLSSSLADWLLNRAVTPVVVDAFESLFPEAMLSPESDLADKVEAIIVLGGDGTFIHAAGMIGDRGIPLFGINLGVLGFLTEFTLDEMYPMLERILAGEYETESRMRLSVTLCKANGEELLYHVLNDIVIHNAVARIMELEAFVDGQYLTTYRADGLIVATPTGSTAYSLSAGGPILCPGTRAIVMAPICPHTLTNRPLVLPDQVILTLKPCGESEQATLSLDGQVQFALEAGCKVMVRRNQDSLKIIRSPFRDYFQILRQKLKWGER